MGDALFDRLAPTVGRDALRRDASGHLRALPTSIDALAHLMGVAHDGSLRVAIAGSGTWQAEDAPSDLTVSLRGLDEITDIAVAEHHVTAQGGATIDRVRREGLERGMWFPIDAPGRPDRTIGSVISTGTTGPLRHGLGHVREHVVGLTIVGGDGRVSRLAGGEGTHDQPGSVPPQVGAFGAFGIVAAAQVRLRELPRADVTWIATSDRDRLTGMARDLMARSVAAASIELFSPSLAVEQEWLLAVRLTGSPDAVDAGALLVTSTGTTAWTELAPERRTMLWGETARAVTAAPVTIRLGVLAEGIDETIDLVVARLGEGLLSAGPASGTIRWSGAADASALEALRAELATREIPLTLERAPWEVRHAIGHLGAYREGARAPIAGLRDTFDPRRVIVAPLGAPHDA